MAPLWLNLGSGDYPAPAPWTNVDGPGMAPHLVDEQVDITGDWPAHWADLGVARIYLGHVLEHLSIADCAGLLERLHDVATSDCALMVVGPDVVRAERMYAAGDLSAEWLRLVKEGGHRWPGDQHLWHCEPHTLIRLLADAGWGNIREIPVGLVPQIWPLVSGVGWQCAVEASA